MTTNEIISAFRQGGTGNCVAIAIIKAGIEVFGMNKIFVSAERTESTYKVVMRDGVEIEFTHEELDMAVLGSRFIRLNNEEIYNYANFCFAAMAKRAQKEGNDGTASQSFQEAMESLNDGEYYLEGPHWIGLSQYTRSIGRIQIFSYPGVLGASRKHCFLASYGIEDKHGDPNPITMLENRACRWLRISTEEV